MMLPKKVKIVEVGARDGLQNESRAATVAVRVELIRLLAAAGLTSIEAGSFVSAERVPQMANSDAVLKAALAFDAYAGGDSNTAAYPVECPVEYPVEYPVLVPNLRGLDAALQAGAKHIAVFAAASEAFSRKNINCGVDESIERFAAVTERALASNLRVRGYVSCALGCPYQGEVAAAEVARVAGLLRDLGCYEISLGDTNGVGTPGKARAMLERVAEVVPVEQLAAHFHDTFGQALANIYAALQAGVRVVDTAVAGLGGCPFAPGAAGNAATEDVVYMLDGLGIDSGVDLSKLRFAADFICAKLERPNYSKAAVALANRS
ncbi:MAG: hydroxymethylglutaryl-CoA lyase [Gammaproteobacteria bacterium]|nr:hydroxymethylglutaryl-CoA lyase [Gammaproteobacteria bacterium]